MNEPAAAVQPTVHTTVEHLVRAQLLRALGGIRGTVEAALPVLAFLVVWYWLHEVRDDEAALRPALVAAGAVMLVLVVLRAVQRQTVQHVLSGVLVVVIGAVAANRSGNASDFFLPGILYNAGLGVVFVVSILVRWPALGVVYGALTQDLTGWRARPEVVTLFQKLTAVFTANYVIRVAVQLPLYLAGSVTVLGITKLVLGWPLLAVSVVVIGFLLARGNTPIDVPATEGSGGAGPVEDGVGDVPATGHDQHP